LAFPDGDLDFDGLRRSANAPGAYRSAGKAQWLPRFELKPLLRRKAGAG
jgi:hypothetical protein